MQLKLYHFETNLLKFAFNGPMNKKLALVPEMAGRRGRKKPLTKPTTVQFIDTYMFHTAPMI